MSVISNKCPNCGGPLGFNPDLQKCKCEFCLSEFTVPEVEAYEAAEAQKANSQQEPFNQPEGQINQDSGASAEHANMRQYNCPSCGASIVTDEVTSAAFCCYCHNPVIMEEQVSGVFRPELVLPFKFKREQAVERLIAWYKKKKFLPKAFISQSQLEKITGLYLPYWLTDCDIDASLRAKCENVSTWRSGNMQYTKTDTYDVYREASMCFNNIPHDASKKTDDRLTESIEPFDCSEIKPFNPMYLSGFFAEKYDVDKEAILPVIKQRTDAAVKQELRSAMQYNHVHEQGFNTVYNRMTVKYALLPIWMITYLYGGKIYTYAMNGQTGKAFGILPLSKAKLAALFGGVAAAVFIALFIFNRGIFF
ncbi:MAG: hypothetical protein LBQ48_02755 [Oscillospiraceae bacterium]|jgi:DNA-directed RNA polymerase subunit RPC12/RpoP|nr:hypothetical protein [Oscillospiraceae bacterium]